jgi:hypothetical protein
VPRLKVPAQRAPDDGMASARSWHVPSPIAAHARAPASAGTKGDTARSRMEVRFRQKSGRVATSPARPSLAVDALFRTALTRETFRENSHFLGVHHQIPGFRRRLHLIVGQESYAERSIERLNSCVRHSGRRDRANSARTLRRAGFAQWACACQSASDRAPGSASKGTPPYCRTKQCYPSVISWA